MDERRLCYEVQGKSRGTYILVYFNCGTDKVKGVERDVQLSELITRVLVLRTDRMSKEDLEKKTPLEAVPEPEETVEAAPAAETAPEEASPVAEAAPEAEAVTEAASEVSAEPTENA